MPHQFQSNFNSIVGKKFFHWPVSKSFGFEFWNISVDTDWAPDYFSNEIIETFLGSKIRVSFKFLTFELLSTSTVVDAMCKF